MTVKMKRATVRLKKDEIGEKKASNRIDSKIESFSFRRRLDFGGSLLDLRKKQDSEVFSSDKKKFYRRKTDIESCKELSDNELIKIIQKQNRQAYFDLFRRYQKKLFVYIYHLVRDRDEAEDILQNVFTKTYKNIQNFDLERKFSSWIYRIAHNESINYLKRKNKRYMLSWEDISTSRDKLETASNEESMEDRFFHQEVTKEIGAALKKLPKQYQLILEMRYFKEYSYEQISKILGKPVNTVGTIINRAKKKLCEIVKTDMRK